VSTLIARAGEPTPGRPAPRGRWFLPTASLLALAVLAVTATAVYRHLALPGRAVLPSSWCQVGSIDSLPPMLGSALLTRWQLDPIALVVLGLMGSWYLLATLSVRRLGGGLWPIGRTASFLAGLVVCGLATNSSIAVYDMALFTAHMVGHLMLVMLGPILLCGGRPLELLLVATGPPWHDRVARVLAGRVASLILCPPIAFASYTAVIVGSHLTGLMNSIMTRPWAGQLEHLVYVVVGVQFFTLVVGDAPIRWRLTTPARWIMLALSMSVDTFTGVILIMSTQPVAMMTVPGLDVDALRDTRTGGALMWVGGDGLMAALMIVLAFSWLRRPDRQRADADSWAEAARRQTFEEHTGATAAHGPTGDGVDFDADDANRARYNEWLAAMARGETGASR
jgi:cytochrome c oxidase assembly factor CtaG